VTCHRSSTARTGPSATAPATGPDGKLHSRSFARKDDAQRWLVSEEASKLKGTWIDPRRSRQLFDDWAEEWWAVWSSNPRRSPTTLEATENRLRRHVRPEFGRRALRAISVRQVQQWQDKLEATLGHESVMACRSILNRILQAAEDERLIPFNPLRKVKAPRRTVDPEVVFGRVQRRTLSPQEFGRFLAACPAFYRDHFIVHVGSGLRSGDLLGLRPPRGPGAAAHRGRRGALRRRQVRLPVTRIGPRATPASA
jgi:integrase